MIPTFFLLKPMDCEGEFTICLLCGQPLHIQGLNIARQDPLQTPLSAVFLPLTLCFVGYRVSCFPTKCPSECSSLSGISDPMLILASGSGSCLVGTGGSNKWKSKVEFPLPRVNVLAPPCIHSFSVKWELEARALT